MSEKAKWVVKAASAGALALVLATPSFAQSRDERRRNNNDDRDRGRTQSSRSYRENERVTAEGRVSSFKRERDGYRVQLDQGRYSYWVPQSYFRNRNRGLSVGLSIRLGGVFRNGSIYVDAVNWPGDRGYGYNDGVVNGFVDRVDVRRDTLWLRDDRGGELIAVELRDSNRRGRIDLRDLRRGDYVELSGQWARGGVFEAYRIEDVRSRR